ncbi:hypothetical protein AVEN_43556-1 [Araneus ventricosus]|uniref:Uncharacterized protein n=1 Tax=Araneus ventricosus TaxID=182803 RepID=A0A4Y2EI44_ARAVE|nr:hypothetical protein AVEN_43556-1 [Araneus ventricosus]
MEVLRGIYFDGRKDKTLVMEKAEDGYLHRHCKVQEHLSVLQEPGDFVNQRFVKNPVVPSGVQSGIVVSADASAPLTLHALIDRTCTGKN